MNPQTVNVSTGPVHISREVKHALSAAPFSHRSLEFKRLYNNTADFLCSQFKVDKSYLITGSGTAANEAMIWQIKLLQGNGLILSNGEFGKRLIDQANRASLQFAVYDLLWGQGFDLAKLEDDIQQNQVKWILFCHCETSTGVVNDLAGVSALCSRFNCLCFVDCMSTAGTHPIDLSHVAMATASSGKGLASIPGLAIIFSNIKMVSSNHIPAYLDLGFHDNKEGVPFTISSNLLNALNVSVKQKLQHEQFQLINFYSKQTFNFLNENNLLPFNNINSKVFTISHVASTKTSVIDKLKKERIIVSYESEYLRKRDWCQVALFGYYEESELDYFFKTLKKTMSNAKNFTMNFE